jgi:hypothetical protein
MIAFDKKKSTIFFHIRISRSGKGRVSDFSATRVRVDGMGSPRVSEKVTHEAPTASGIQEMEKNTFFFCEDIRVRVQLDSPILWIDMYIPSADAWHRQRRELCH